MNNLLRPTYEQRGIAFHEAGHSVFSLILTGHHGHTGASIWPITDAGDHWRGVCHAMPDGPSSTPYMPNPASTPPRLWNKCAQQAWVELVLLFAGAAAARKYEGLPLTAKAIRNDYGATLSDTRRAVELCAHYWPEPVRETVVDRAAITAAEMLNLVPVWRAITAVADYLAVRRNIHVTEIETLVRRHFPMAVVCPGTAWAMGQLTAR